MAVPVKELLKKGRNESAEVTIVKFLKAKRSLAFSTKEIALETNCNLNTIRSVLRKLMKRGKVKRAKYTPKGEKRPRWFYYWGGR